MVIKSQIVDPADDDAEEDDVDVAGCEDYDEGEREYEGVEAQRVVDVNWCCLEAESSNEERNYEEDQESAII